MLRRFLYHGTGIRASHGGIASLTTLASGGHSEAIIFGGGTHDGGNNAVSAYTTLGPVSITRAARIRWR